MNKRTLRQLRALDFVVSLIIGLPLGLRSVWHFVPEPAVYQRVIWTLGTVGAIYIVLGLVIVAVVKDGN